MWPGLTCWSEQASSRDQLELCSAASCLAQWCRRALGQGCWAWVSMAWWRRQPRGGQAAGQLRREGAAGRAAEATEQGSSNGAAGKRIATQGEQGGMRAGLQAARSKLLLADEGGSKTHCLGCAALAGGWSSRGGRSRCASRPPSPRTRWWASLAAGCRGWCALSSWPSAACGLWCSTQVRLWLCVSVHRTGN